MTWISRPLIVLGDDQVSQARSLNTQTQDREQRYLSFDGKTPHPLNRMMAEFLEALVASPLGETLVTRAYQEGYVVEWVETDEEVVRIDNDNRILFLPNYNLSTEALARSVYFTHATQMNLLRGLRRIDQNRGDARPLYLQPDQAVFMARIRAADELAVTLHVIYAMREKATGLWRHFLGSEYGDMAARYAEGMAVMAAAKGDQQVESEQTDPQMKTALNGAFLLWFRCEERVDQFDRITLNQIDQNLQNSKTPSLYRARVTPKMFENVTRVGSTTYLNDLTRSALQSPICRDVFDPINIRHLNQIMQERDLIMINNVGFRDPGLARAIFPQT